MNDIRLADYLDHIRDAARLARTYVENMSREEFLADTRTQQAVILNLYRRCLHRAVDAFIERGQLMRRASSRTGG
jgi:hypothetical protein